MRRARGGSTSRRLATIITRMTLGVLSLWLAVTVPPGVVVDRVAPGYSAAEAGVRTGDVLLAWERAQSAGEEPAQGTLASPFDVEEVQREQAPHGTVTLHGTRSGEAFLVRVPPGEWELTTRPALDDNALRTYQAARAILAGDDPDSGLSLLRELAATRPGGSDEAALWLLFAAAGHAADKARWAAADAALADARRAAEAAGEAGRLARVHGVVAFAASCANLNEWDRATRAYGEALEARRAFHSPSLLEARILGRLGSIADTRGDMTAAEVHLRRALAIREQVAPQSLDVSHGLYSLGVHFWIRGDLEAAEQHHRRALEIRERLTPQSVYVANSLNNLGLLADRRGDLAAGEELYRQALEIQERVLPESLHVASTLHNLARTAGFRGNIAAAEDLYRRSLVIKEKLAPVSLTAANSLTNLGELAHRRGDLDAAEDYSRRAIAIMEKVGPNNLTVAENLSVLGAVARERGDLAAAAGHSERALALTEKIAPDSLEVAAVLRDLGDLSIKRGDAEQAKSQLQRALAIAERIAPRGLTAADILHSLGELDLTTGDLGAAEASHRRSLDIREELTPGSAEEAASCQRLATIERRKGQREEALVFYRRALEALDTQRQKLGGTDVAQARFGERHAPYYREALALLVAMGHPEEAFHVLERYRARALLALLAERDLAFSADVPQELDRERRRANIEYERTLARLATAKGADALKLQQTLARNRRQQALVQEQIRAASPRLAALQYPEPLDLARTRSVLDPGTVLLSFAVGEDESFVFAVGPAAGDFVVAPLGLGRPALSAAVKQFRELVQKPQVLRLRQLQATARRLSDALLRPVRDPIARSARVLIVPDGPLHLVPFSALADPTSPGRHRYLAQARPVHVAASVTVLAELKKGRGRAGARQLIAFGDPDYSAVAATNTSTTPEWSAARTRGLDLDPLPASRTEVEGIASLYRDRSRVYLGAQATEERAKAIRDGASVIHFATHALADEASPLESALALSLPGRWEPGRDNGLLQAWEVFEQLRIDADLVTLSACGTALGKEMSGEGLLGLTRAFQYAGARSVLASLWEVSDASTADLMRSFYGHWGRGVAKAEALRRAQLELLKRPATSAPFYWAAFELIGDWR